MIAPRSPLGHDATIGILGGGQLGRMLALAAARLGFKCHVLCPDPHSPAFDVVRRVTEADYADMAALDRFANDVDVVTYEFENVPAETATFLSARRPVLPDPKVLATTQDRLIEKAFVQSLGIATARFAAVDSAEGLAAALATIGRPAVLKTRRFGYDGKGQAIIRDGQGADLFDALGGQAQILEAFVPFEREISVVAARGAGGEIESFDVTENTHEDHILRTSRAPAAVSAAVATEARRIAETIAQAFGYVGVLAVEMFVVKDGHGHAVLVNEIAPRVHNSGHWTIDGASVSQFEQHIRAVAGLPLAKPIRRGRAEMMNLLGEEANDVTKWLQMPATAVHLYGKTAARPGRKMGHVTRVLPE
ncbi:MAG TPA: 5-(carboxyamino)imidazole ribonucleotide synthase [Xanthobacteraceae bacterium]|nr:5-(carboxyamino)imidazole ribonucleotide synthase [Xanthobacteraceae bacterium]